MSGVLPADEVARRVERAIYDPGKVLPRGDDYAEPLFSWQARAVLAALDGHDEALRSQLAAAHDVIRELVGAIERSPAYVRGVTYITGAAERGRAVLDAADATPTEAHDG